MRKWVVLLAMGVALLALGGCKRSNIAQNLGPTLDNWQAGGEANSVSQSVRISDIVPATDGTFGGALNFAVTALPSGAGLGPVRFFAIDDWIGQIEYERARDGGQPEILVVRVAGAGEPPLSTTYTEAHNLDPETTTIDGVEVSVGTSRDGCVLVSWTRGDFQYTLHSNKLQGMPAAADIEMLVSGLDSASV